MDRIKQLSQKHYDLLYMIGVILFGFLIHGFIFLVFWLLDFSNLQLNAILQLTLPLVYFFMILLLIKQFNLNLKFEWISLKPSIVISVLLLFFFVFIVQESLDITFVKELINGKLKFLDYRAPLKYGVNPILSDFSAVVIAPIFEEILYRKIFFQKLKERYGVRLGVIMSSVLFSLLHLNLDGLIPYFLVGVVFAYVYHLTKALWLNIVAHSTYNIIVSFTMVKVFEPGESFFIVGVIAYIFSVYGIYIILKELRNLLE